MHLIESAHVIDNHINIRALNAVALLPQIMRYMEDNKISVADLSIRQNTLEDVFIELTGTGLRE